MAFRPTQNYVYWVALPPAQCIDLTARTVPGVSPDD